MEANLRNPLIGYVIIISISYPLGYWWAFNINVFEYGTIVDIAKMSIAPLLTSLTPVIFGIVVGHLWGSKKLPAGEGANTKTGRFLRKHIHLLAKVYIVSIYAIGVFVREPLRWFFIIPMTAPVIAIPLQHYTPLIEKIPQPNTRMLITFLLVFVPIIAFYLGRSDACRVKMGRPDISVDVGRSKLALVFDKSHPVGVIGFIDEAYVLYESLDGRIVFVKQKDAAPIYFIPNNY